MIRHFSPVGIDTPICDSKAEGLITNHYSSVTCWECDKWQLERNITKVDPAAIENREFSKE